MWVEIAVIWACAAAAVIIMLPLIESRRGIVQVLMKIGQRRTQQEKSNGFDLTDNSERITTSHHNRPHKGSNSTQGFFQKKILVPFDGSPQSLRALYSAANMYANSLNTECTIFILHIIEWIDENEEEIIDEELATAMKEQGKKILRSVLLPARTSEKYERVIKLGDPSSKIVEVAEKLKVDLIAMGMNGKGNAKEIGHVSGSVIKSSSIPALLLK